MIGAIKCLIQNILLIGLAVLIGIVEGLGQAWAGVKARRTHVELKKQPRA